MATVVPFASCYDSRGPRGASYLSLLAYRGPRFTPRPRLAGHNPKMTLRQILRMLKMMKREAGFAAPGYAVSRHHVRQEMCPRQPKTQAQRAARRGQSRGYQQPLNLQPGTVPRPYSVLRQERSSRFHAGPSARKGDPKRIQKLQQPSRDQNI